MKFQILPADLKSAIVAIGDALPSKSPLPVLENILIAPVQSSDDAVTQVSLTASDGDMVATVSIPVSECEGLQPALIPAEKLRRYIKVALSIFPVEFEYNPTNQEWKVADQDGEFCFVSFFKVDEYPAYKPLADGASTITVPKDFFLGACGAASAYAANDELRPQMCGVFVRVSGDTLAVAASDSKLLFSDNVALAQPSGEASFILPTRAVSLLTSLFANETCDTLDVATDGRYLSVVTGGRTLKVRLIEGRYPRYEAVIPKQIARFAVIDAARLIAGMKRVEIGSASSTNLVKMEWSKGNLALYAQDIDFSLAAQCKVSCTEASNLDSFAIGVRSVAFINAVKTVARGDVRVEMCDDNSRPILVRPSSPDSNRLVLVCPMQLNNF